MRIQSLFVLAAAALVGACTDRVAPTAPGLAPDGPSPAIAAVCLNQQTYYFVAVQYDTFHVAIGGNGVPIAATANGVQSYTLLLTAPMIADLQASSAGNCKTNVVFNTEAEMYGSGGGQAQYTATTLVSATQALTGLSTRLAKFRESGSCYAPNVCNLVTPNSASVPKGLRGKLAANDHLDVVASYTVFGSTGGPNSIDYASSTFKIPAAGLLYSPSLVIKLP